MESSISSSVEDVFTFQYKELVKEQEKKIDLQEGRICEFCGEEIPKLHRLALHVFKLHFKAAHKKLYKTCDKCGKVFRQNRFSLPLCSSCVVFSEEYKRTSNHSSMNIPREQINSVQTNEDIIKTEIVKSETMNTNHPEANVILERTANKRVYVSEPQKPDRSYTCDVCKGTFTTALKRRHFRSFQHLSYTVRQFNKSSREAGFKVQSLCRDKLKASNPELEEAEVKPEPLGEKEVEDMMVDLNMSKQQMLAVIQVLVIIIMVSSSPSLA